MVQYITSVVLHMDGLVQDCSNSTADALELLQPYIKPPIYSLPVPGIRLRSRWLFYTMTCDNRKRARNHKPRVLLKGKFNFVVSTVITFVNISVVDKRRPQVRHSIIQHFTPEKMKPSYILNKDNRDNFDSCSGWKLDRFDLKLRQRFIST